MSVNNFPRVFLKSNEEKEILQGFPWVFDNEISHFKHRNNEKGEWKNEELLNCSVNDGEIIEVYTKSGGFLGTGILNKKSKIAVRIFDSQHADKISENLFEYWHKKIINAYNLRKNCFSKEDSYRLVFAEADFIPGFICERFCDEHGRIFLVVQFLALACEIFRKEILNALEKVCSPNGIFERSDVAVRTKEGLPLVCGWIGRQFEDKITITENGIKFDIDLVNGQKTGYFLDQKFNRLAVKKFCKDKRILDAFTHTGAFGLNAACAGAKEVICVDISQQAVDLVNRNIQINHQKKIMKVICADVFDLLKKYEKENQKFDVIILDPPAFTKSAKMIEKAYGGYKEINLRAMRLLKNDGILVTCSCSYFMESNMFCDMIMHAAADSHKRVQILEKRGASFDHPVLLGYPKSEYLKCVVCRVF